LRNRKTPTTKSRPTPTSNANSAQLVVTPRTSYCRARNSGAVPTAACQVVWGWSPASETAMRAASSSTSTTPNVSRIWNSGSRS